MKVAFIHKIKRRKAGDREGEREKKKKGEEWVGVGAPCPDHLE